MIVAATVVMVAVRTPHGHGNPGLVDALNLDWCLGYVCCLCVLFVRALWLESHREVNEPLSDGGRSSWRRAARLASPTAALAALYAFVLPVLGLQERFSLRVCPYRRSPSTDHRSSRWAMEVPFARSSSFSQAVRRWHRWRDFSRRPSFRFADSS